VDTSSDGEPSVPSSGTDTPQAFSWLARMTDASRRSRSGMTCARLTDARGEAVLTWCLAAFLAKTSRSPAPARDCQATEVPSGSRWPASFAKWDHATSSWRTPQCSIDGGSTEFSGIWPRWGSMRSGACTARSKPELLTSDSGRGLWPTPTVDSATERTKKYAQGGMPLSLAVRQDRGRIPTPTVGDSKASGSRNTESSKAHPGTSLTDFVREDGGRGRIMGVVQAGGQLNPTWVEWLMGWPLGWTDCDASAMDRFRKWCASHGARW
jgi:hypothetical protein